MRLALASRKRENAARAAAQAAGAGGGWTPCSHAQLSSHAACSSDGKDEKKELQGRGGSGAGDVGATGAQVRVHMSLIITRTPGKLSGHWVARCHKS